MQVFDNYIDGLSVPPVGGAYFETENPFTRRAWAKVARSDGRDVEAAVAAASAAFQGPWHDTTPTERAARLRRLGDLVLANVDRLAEAEVRDNGKTITEIRTQMRNISEWYYYYGGLADKLAGEVLHTERRNMFNYTRYEPLGVIAMITPWNSPLRLLAWKLAPALAAGNTAVLKPSEYTSTSALLFAEIVQEAGFPPGVFNIVTGLGAEVGAALAAHPQIAKIAFTGGGAGGAAVYEAAARNLKPVALELGGKSPNIVFEDADLDNAARGAVSAIFGSCGQTCIAGSRLLVQRSIYDRVLAAAVALAGEIRLGDPMDPATQIGPVANEPQFDKIMRYIDVAKADGATLACGGKRAEGAHLRDALFVEPTIFANVRNDMRIAREEVFGPILSVIPFEDESEAIRIANDTPFGLGAGIWTQNLARAHRVASKLQAGSVWVNTYRVTSQLSPFGGYKQSGLGREGGAEMLKGYLQTKSVWIDLADEFAYPFKAASSSA